jgi:hypothetical protein
MGFRKGESVRALANRMEEQIMRLTSVFNVGIDDFLKKHIFRRCLLNPVLRNMSVNWDSPFKTVVEAALTAEANLRAGGAKIPAPGTTGDVPSTSGGVTSMELGMRDARGTPPKAGGFPKGSCFNCGSMDHFLDKCSAPARKGLSDKLLKLLGSALKGKGKFQGN